MTGSKKADMFKSVGISSGAEISEIWHSGCSVRDMQESVHARLILQQDTHCDHLHTVTLQLDAAAVPAGILREAQTLFVSILCMSPNIIHDHTIVHHTLAGTCKLASQRSSGLLQIEQRSRVMLARCLHPRTDFT